MAFDKKKFGFLIPLVMIPLLGAIIMMIKKSVHKKRRGENSAALEILKWRYAKGEISQDEFDEKRRNLSMDTTDTNDEDEEEDAENTISQALSSN